ncbi:NAD-dependent epimerase/dehydratase family protein [Rhodoplanes sp. TEM]|uniref:NAD-dependent epimerase/dehydratase family protein n=1 Tax=Rhodoplanes tepidamans TaxID=200616 RepID=A0ABT5JHY4_RHOTP|nr:MULTISPECIES: NAD-dependent epimerase/dehydratase family protein [Rhodoplanes]MDC7789324.1 NAD-dependent epimerase/dehydratase family protein [Rhodoplanes tepidamans]MDC7986013.1 NAD-dependent epimerase/dehydratase family protein [Rhodoplanes sp. TEM]MDQ0358997.1 nucleoside-diphosphate-sugar epimerase [Rhodoplanes tepidamans]
MNNGGTALVCGAGGFIGGHLARRLKQDGWSVHGVDIASPAWGALPIDTFTIGDLRDPAVCRSVIDRRFDEVYQLAADMGGAGYIFTGDNDAAIMRNSALINLNVLEACRLAGCERVFFSSSACVYPRHHQHDADSADCVEASAYPADPDSEYGWEKLFCERLYLAFNRNHGMRNRIARFHNVFGPYGAWTDGREKVPAAICRKVAEARDGGEIEVWGDGEQLRSFLYVDECVEGMLRLMRTPDFEGPVNIGSDRPVTINRLVDMVCEIAGKRLTRRHVPGPTGVRARNSDNTLIRERLGWAPSQPLQTGLAATYEWIAAQVEAVRADAAPAAPASTMLAAGKAQSAAAPVAAV